jgi:hypothetical protein
MFRETSEISRNNFFVSLCFVFRETKKRMRNGNPTCNMFQNRSFQGTFFNKCTMFAVELQNMSGVILHRCLHSEHCQDLFCIGEYSTCISQEPCYISYYAERFVFFRKAGFNTTDCIRSSVAEPHHFYAAPVPDKNFDAASATATAPVLFLILYDLSS